MSVPAIKSIHVVRAEHLVPVLMQQFFDRVDPEDFLEMHLFISAKIFPFSQEKG